MQLAYDAPMFAPGLPGLAAIGAAQSIARQPCAALHGRSRKELARCAPLLAHTSNRAPKRWICNVVASRVS